MNLLAPRPPRGSSDKEFVRWANAALKDALGDAEALHSCSGIFYFRPGEECVDLTPGLIARSERRAGLLMHFIKRRRPAAAPVDHPMRKAG